MAKLHDDRAFQLPSALLRVRPVADSLQQATSSGVPWATIRPPASGGAWADINNVVGCFHHLFVVFNDNQRMPTLRRASKTIE